MTQNQLAHETSPYLLQHKDNPVHWRPWGAEALDEARRDDKPILLSVGYAACHWCHVMAHESFEDSGVAELMNELFVNVKVDREERPDIDHIYQSALAMLGEHGGWPLTMFLTPRGEPFWGGTYFPPSPRYGRPGFPDVLRGVARIYRAEPEKVAKNVAALTDALAKLAAPAPGEGLTAASLDAAATQVLRLIDPIHGGTVGAPKFPQPMLFRLLWRAYRRTGSTLFRDAVTTTLNAMAQGGIYDHLGGGFARYSTDEVWLAPHFEKMLYDNALLIDLMTEVWQDTRSPLYARRIAETVDWAMREMRVDADGGFAFASALDADSEGEEGRFYVWREDEIDALLGAEAPVFKEAYDVTPRGNWEGKTILNRSRAPLLGSDALEDRLAEGRATLFAARAGRVRPGRDDKVLADWNGLMIAALAHASAAFDRPEWLEAARTAFAFVRDRMQDGGRLRHSWCAGRAAHPAVMEDYANMARAALALFEVGAGAEYLDQARAWVALADRHHWDDDAGGYFLSADDTDDVISRQKTVADNATPAGNGTMVDVLARLHWLTGDAEARARAERVCTVFSGDGANAILASPGLLAAFELLQGAHQVVIVGGDDESTQALRRAAFQAPQPLRVVNAITGDDALPDGHPARGKGAVDGRAAAYVCVGTTCSLPITDAEELKRHLAGA